VGEENVGTTSRLWRDVPHALSLQNTISALSDVMKQNSHDRKYLRLKHFDYSLNGAYFVTICTNDRNTYFEKYPNLRKVIHSFWNNLKIKFPVIELDEFVVMPNHVHCIIFIIGGNDVIRVGAIPRLWRDVPHESPLHNRRNMLLPKVVGYFKMNTAKQINRILNRSGQSL
jgi:putative transposase